MFTSLHTYPSYLYLTLSLFYSRYPLTSLTPYLYVFPSDCERGGFDSSTIEVMHRHLGSQDMNSTAAKMAAERASVRLDRETVQNVFAVLAQDNEQETDTPFSRSRSRLEWSLCVCMCAVHAYVCGSALCASPFDPGASVPSWALFSPASVVSPLLSAFSYIQQCLYCNQQGQ